jgi:predicted component of type VI protein secretion system
VAEIADFLLLQAVNRYEPLFKHMAHREQSFRAQVLAGAVEGYANTMSGASAAGQPHVV